MEKEEEEEKKRSGRKEQRVKAGDEEGIKETFAIKNTGI